ncbi:S8 family serine peptidase [Duganella aceris]|uniref:S8 family serine peptidase n=1 Tax=Duganella aceris TaxID=2703883 RepID=A0ABX0FF49_9BURK|nr:S8 family serine peptidase [Duganella aceris]NGZ83164.1 S8 family serine peptidase [Duganella aceris]
MKLHPVSLAVLLLCATVTHSAGADEARRSYLVRLTDKPVAAYTGGVAGLRATQPSGGVHLDLNSPEVQVYSAYLDQQRAKVRATVPAAPVIYDYKVVFNGFAAMLTDAEVRQLAASSGVSAVFADERRRLLTSYTPTFLGLDQPGGLWSQLGGKEHAGEDVVIGVLDGGVWPESLSYADRVDAQGKPSFDAAATPAYGAPPASWKGECTPGEGFELSHCNNKLIGAQYFDADYREQGLTPHWSDFRSARDSLGGGVGHGGHGTHTSTTAGGNNGVAAGVDGVAMGATSGMAPRARIAMYKVCWSYQDDTDATGATSSCFTGDSVAAVEKAVIDGVNVINYSISGGDRVDDPVEQAFLHAASAGVFVAAAAGNSGPTVSVNHVSPWLATVAASTHDRQMSATLTLASGVKYIGASLNQTPLPSSPLIRAEDAGVAGADATALSLCYSAASNGGAPLLDAAKVRGKIVSCTRGSIDRVEKSRAVLEAGGVGMVLVDDGNGPVADVHSVPTVHVGVDDGHRIQQYAQAKGAAGDISRFAPTRGLVPAPVVAGFSSRGPNRTDPNLLKPDLAAPGVDILAGVTPGLTPAQRDAVALGTLTPPTAFAFYQGTSMATPHVAGLAALLHQRHPDWSPAAIKSALMTSATDTLPDQLSGAAAGILPWGQGAGQVTPNGAADPGLVYDAALPDYRKYMCGLGIADQCADGTLQAFNLNLASITVDNVMGSQLVTRSVTNVGDRNATYHASASLSGFSVTVTPAELTLAPGERKNFTVTLTRNGAPDKVWQYGHLVWSDGTHSVRSPVQARSGPPLVAPALVTADRASGMRLMSVNTGYSGKLTAVVGGMKEVTRTALSVGKAASGSADTVAQAVASCKAGATGFKLVPFSVPAGTVAARFETFDRDIDGGADGRQDLDMVLLSGGALVDYSMHVGANEAIILSSPPAGAYQLCLIGYDLAGGAPAAFTLSSALVGKADAGGNLKAAAPGKVYAGSTATVGLSWSGLAAGKRYVGGVQLLDASGAVAATTVVSIGTDAALPLAGAEQRVSKRKPTL